MDWLPIAVPVLTTAMTALLAYFATVSSSRDKRKADTDDHDEALQSNILAALKRAEERIETLTKRNDEMQKQIDELRNTRTEEREKAEDEIYALRQRVRTLEEENAKLQRKVERLTREVETGSPHTPSEGLRSRNAAD